MKRQFDVDMLRKGKFLQNGGEDDGITITVAGGTEHVFYPTKDGAQYTGEWHYLVEGVEVHVADRELRDLLEENNE